MATREILRKKKAQDYQRKKEEYRQNIEAQQPKVDEFISEYYTQNVSTNSLEFKFRSEEHRKKWEMLVEKNCDDDSKKLSLYVQEWGKIMQLAVCMDLTVPQVAEQTSWIKFPIECLQSDFFVKAVELLCEYWRYGDDVNEWYHMTMDI